MKFFALTLVALVGLVHGVDVTKENEVVVLTDDVFDEFVAENQYVLVEFYAPWCGHCKALAPEYEKAADELKKAEAGIVLAKVDATVETKLAGKFGVRGYPTIKFFKGGNPSEYGGGRTGPEIVAWLSKKTGPAAKTLTTAEEATQFFAEKEVAVIGFFSNVDSAEAQAYLAAADGIDDIEFAITSEAAVNAEYEAQDGAIIVIKKFDEGKNVFEGEVTAEAVTAFVRANSLPLVVEFGEATANKIFGGEIKVHNLLFVKKDADNFQVIYDQFHATASAFKGQVLFVLIDGAADSNTRILEYFGLKDEDMPTVRLITLDGDMKKYKPTSAELTTETLTQFVTDFQEGNLKPHLNSEPLPEDWDANPVKILVGENFVDVALDPAKDVFVEFYAPWCGHCKQLAPIYEELGEHFKDNADVVIAKMDSTKNEVEEAAIRSFPTLKLWKKDSNEMVDYNGGRTLEEMIQFIESGGETVGEVDDEDFEEDEEEDDQVRDEL